ncbi:MAG TPA: SurA N-terminal domain-containing protein, partial [Alphaproteobacteria bacterium]|nr:SurA N-terminal domain-containing protein [Alphaproteobacteria bacterium]
MLALLAALPGIGHAGSVERIAAIVNDEIVSGYDIEQRIDLVLATTNLQHPEETRRRLRHQVLRTLIDERLQMQEARKLNLKVTDEDLQRAYRYLERQNNIPQGQLDEYL